MVERRPPGFNVDLDFADSKEVMSIPRRHRLAAVGLWTLCGTWSAKKLQDGYVSAEVLKMYGATRPVVESLIASTLWKPADAGAVWFTNWPRWQRTRDEVASYRQSEAARKKAARDAAKNTATSGEGETSARTSAGRPQDVRAEAGDPSTKTENRELREVKLGGEVTSVGAGVDEPPPRTCPRHPDGTEIPCGACANARRKHDDWQNSRSLAAVNDRQAELDARKNCPDCDDAGWTLDSDETIGLVRCHHDAYRSNHA
jgi:hypothetical protein